MDVLTSESLLLSSLLKCSVTGWSEKQILAHRPHSENSLKAAATGRACER
ncbi:hypothetical protein M5D96_009122, partial [Drosophila gunungcola]